MGGAMTDYEMHEPKYDGTTTDEWDAPREHDFDTDDLSEIDDHFVLSSSGFAPDDFADLKLPVVDSEGNLNLNALETAYGGAHSVEAVEGIDDDAVGSVKSLLQQLASEEFDHDIS